MSPLRFLAPTLAIAVTALLSGCGTGIGGPVDGAAPQGSESWALGLATDPFVVVDLQSGGVTPREQVADLGANPEYRRSLLVLRRMPAVRGLLGSASPDARADEKPHAVDLPAAFVGVFEVTRGQWRLVMGSNPWQDVQENDDTDNLPAVGISYAAAQEFATRVSMRLWRGTMSLPDDDRWEAACRAGATGNFAWGDEPYAAGWDQQAMVSERTDRTGVQPVGSAVGANAYGLYDMQGNVWEWTASRGADGEANLRGGSYRQTVWASACGLRMRMLDAVTHPEVGLRVVYAP